MMNSSVSYGHMYGAPWFYGFGGGVDFLLNLVAIILIIALVILKGYALWHAAKRDQKWWFVALLLINTAGILEAIYIIFFVKEWHKKKIKC